MAVARARTSAFAILVSKVTTAVILPSASTTVVVMESVRWVTAVFVIRTGQELDAILRHATTFKDVQVRALSDSFTVGSIYTTTLARML